MQQMSFNKLTVRHLPIEDRRVLMRVDFNVPLDGGRILDNSRIASSLPTIRYLRERRCRIVLMSHLGRPRGKPDPKLSLGPVARLLAELLDAPVKFVPVAVGESAEAATAALAPGGVALLENVRFDPGDEANDSAYAALLARHGEIYVNDAFGAAHRAHASTSGVAAHLPAVAGMLLESELNALGGLLTDPARPFLVVLGGAKIKDKIAVIESLLHRCDVLALGGGMANAFLAAGGAELGGSLLETDQVDTARRLLGIAAERGVRVVLPKDRVAAASLDAAEPPVIVPAAQIPPELAGYDIGPATVDAIAAEAATAGTVFWNGPLGVYEVPAYAQGTAGVGHAIAAATRRGAVTVAAGGDVIAALGAAGLAGDFTHLSTGGGASLELLEGKELPGVACLLDAVHPGNRAPH